MGTADWHIVLSRDGTVLDATDGAPRAWVGTRLDDRADVPNELKQAGRDAIDRANHERRLAASPLTPPSVPHTVDLAVADAMPLQRAATDIRDLLRSSLGVLRSQADAFDIALTVHVEDDVPMAVLLDRGKIAWAITTLVGNALRYVRHGSQTMPGGSITVHAAYDAAAREIAIDVQDDGPGIPADRLRSLLSRAPDSSSAPLGLSMIRDVVAAHGGRVTVESKTDVFHCGTTVRVTLPVAA